MATGIATGLCMFRVLAVYLSSRALYEVFCVACFCCSLQGLPTDMLWFGKRKRSESSLGRHAGDTPTAEPTLADSRRHGPVMCNESMQPGRTQAQSQSDLGVADVDACRQLLLGLGPEDLRVRLEVG